MTTSISKNFTSNSNLASLPSTTANGSKPSTEETKSISKINIKDYITDSIFHRFSPGTVAVAKKFTNTREDFLKERPFLLQVFTKQGRNVVRDILLDEKNKVCIVNSNMPFVDFSEFLNSIKYWQGVRGKGLNLRPPPNCTKMTCDFRDDCKYPFKYIPIAFKYIPIENSEKALKLFKQSPVGTYMVLPETINPEEIDLEEKDSEEIDDKEINNESYPLFKLFIRVERMDREFVEIPFCIKNGKICTRFEFRKEQEYTKFNEFIKSSFEDECNKLAINLKKEFKLTRKRKSKRKFD